MHPGDVLREDFRIGSDIPRDEVVAATGIAADRLQALIDGRIPVDADLDLRIGRYLNMSEGFFLRLQNAYDIEEAWRHEGPELDRIVPRAA